MLLRYVFSLYILLFLSEVIRSYPNLKAYLNELVSKVSRLEEENMKLKKEKV